MKSVPNITNLVSSNPVQARCPRYNISGVKHHNTNPNTVNWYFSMVLLNKHAFYYMALVPLY